MKQLEFAGKLALIFACLVILLQASHQAWRYHLQTDTAIYFERVNYFAKYLSFKDLDHNEWQPGATFYYLAPFPLLYSSLAAKNPYQVYLNAFFGLNILMIFLISFFYKISAPKSSLLTFALIIVFMGPILLYRFELFVSMLTVLSYYLWTRQKYSFSSFVLGLAVMTKVYPIILLPYYFILAYKTHGLKQVIKVSLFFAIGAISLTILYVLITQANLSQVLEGFTYHTHKPVHVDSVWGSIITVANKLIYGSYPKAAGGWGIIGIASKYTFLPIQFFNYFWILPMSIFYIWLFIKTQKNSIINPLVCFTIILLFLVVSKSVSPQYLIWFLIFYPFINPFMKAYQTNWLINLILILLICFLTQYVYPLKYTELVSQFYVNGTQTGVFWIYAINHLLLIVLTILSLRACLIRQLTDH